MFRLFVRVDRIKCEVVVAQKHSRKTQRGQNTSLNYNPTGRQKYWTCDVIGRTRSEPRRPTLQQRYYVCYWTYRELAHSSISQLSHTGNHTVEDASFTLHLYATSGEKIEMAAMTVSALLVVMCLVSPPLAIDANPEDVAYTPDKVSPAHEHGSLSSFFRSVPEKVQELPHRIQEGFKELPGKIKEGFKGVPERIAEGFKAVPKRVQEAFDGAVDGAKEMVSSRPRYTK
uniref:Uncharacterized protein n=1 Tax=Timema douglasi TaxID=61478 RepID=A0A7R8ZFK1_TIMDO|nr:unnamed protein product [Timema douglasi]